MEEKKENRGGRRPGAGRPRTDSKIYSFRAPGYMARHIDSLENKTDFIKDCIDLGMKAQADASHALGEMVPASRVKEMALPYFDISVVAGFPVPLDNDEKSQDIDMLRLLCPHPESSYLIRVNGNSMIDAGVMSGDIVIVDKSNRHPSAKEIAVCELNGEYTLKHFVEEGGSGWLIPANPDFPRIQISSEDSFSVWGTVTYIIHKARV